MTFDNIFNPKKNKSLIGHENHFFFFKNLILRKRLPKVTMLTGEKGIGKSTLINHLMHYYFDRNHYDDKNFNILDNTSFSSQNETNLFSNIIYLGSSNFGNIKIDDIRLLKDTLSKTPILKDKRFIILDDVETFNSNSLNALLKLIEEPSDINYFILINNKTKPILETIKSRCLEIKILLDKTTREKIINYLIKYFDQPIVLDKNIVQTSPGNYLKFNFFFNEKKLNTNDEFLTNLKAILSFYKKEKNMIYKDLLLYFTEYHLQRNRNDNFFNDIKFIDYRSNIIKDINNFFIYNLNQSTLINSINRKLNG